MDKSEAVWCAVFGAAFANEVESLYVASWQTPGPGMARSDIADEHGYSCAESAAATADNAVAALERLEHFGNEVNDGE